MITTEIISFATVIHRCMRSKPYQHPVCLGIAHVVRRLGGRSRQRSSDAPSDLGHLLHRLRLDRSIRPLADDSDVPLINDCG